MIWSGSLPKSDWNQAKRNIPGPYYYTLNPLNTMAEPTQPTLPFKNNVLVLNQSSLAFRVKARLLRWQFPNLNLMIHENEARLSQLSVVSIQNLSELQVNSMDAWNFDTLYFLKMAWSMRLQLLKDLPYVGFAYDTWAKIIPKWWCTQKEHKW